MYSPTVMSQCGIQPSYVTYQRVVCLWVTANGFDFVSHELFHGKKPLALVIQLLI